MKIKILEVASKVQIFYLFVISFAVLLSSSIKYSMAALARKELHYFILCSKGTATTYLH